MKRLEPYDTSSMVHPGNRPGRGLTTSPAQMPAPNRPCGDRHAHPGWKHSGAWDAPTRGHGPSQELATEHLTSGLMAS